MTEETVFARWSRLKQAARRPSSTEEAADPSAPPADENVTLPAGQPAAPEDVTLPVAELGPAEGGEDGPLDPLPSLDELTAESDLTAFLRREVPELLKNAALRKMWSIDPAIRDHVGLSECAWDFNSPGGVPGFGPIGETRSLPSFLSRLPEAEMPSRRKTAATVMRRMRRSRERLRFSTYQTSRARRSGHVRAFRPFTCAQPVMPGGTSWRRASSAV